MTRPWRPAALGVLVARGAWACSGPGAEHAITLSFSVAAATWLATVAGAVVVLAVPRLRPRQRGFRLLWCALPLLQTVAIGLLGVTRGDCGFALRWASAVMAGALALSATVGAVRLARAV